MTGLAFVALRPLVKILVHGVRSGRFEATKISKTSWSEDPLSFCLDGLWISGWVCLGLGAWAYFSWEIIAGVLR